MKIYNTMSRQLEELNVDGNVKMYTCGPTVYNYVHIGNIRAYFFADILKRYIKWKGMKLDHVMNITDVEDKLIKAAMEQGKPLKEITELYEKAFMEDMESMRMDMKYKKIVRATESIDDMVKIIEDLLEKEIAYKGEDGIYYDITKFDGYGKLNKIDVSSLKSGARVSQDEYDKEDAHDFALWKFYDKDDGDVFWETSIGKGRPGWHIECSAMSMFNLDDTLDIHTGGVDNAFPHHENEIAQSEAYTGKEFVKYWMHCEHLMVDGKKMAKSAGNFYTLRDLMEKGYDPRAIRFFFLMSHYRSQLNLTFDALDSASRGLNRVDEFISNLKTQDGKHNKEIEAICLGFMNGWKRRMDDDLNTPEAIALLFDFIKTINKEMETGMSRKDAELVAGAMQEIDEVFAILEEDKEIPEEAKKLIEDRNTARKEKNWEESDRLRDQLLEMGIESKDDSTESHYRVK